MGLAPGQARLLMLTSRKSDIELKMVLLSQDQMVLARESQAAAQEYNEKTSNMKLMMKVNSDSESGNFTNEDVSYNNLAMMGYLITDAQGFIYLTKDENGSWIEPKASGLADEKILDNGIEQDEDGVPLVHIKGQQYYIKDGTAMISDKKQLQSFIMNNLLHVLNTTGNDTSGIPYDQLESNTSITWVYDTSDDAAAESKYRVQTAEIKRKENAIDLEIKQLETQHNAITKELESVEKLIGNAAESFNLFSEG